MTTRSAVIVLAVIAIAIAIVVALVLIRRPAAASPGGGGDDPQLGRRTYANCQACHGLDGRGVAGYAPGLVDAPSLAGDGRAAIARVLAGGPGPGGYSAVMPGFARLSDAEIAAVIGYVRSAWGGGGATMDTAVVADVRRSLK